MSHVSSHWLEISSECVHCARDVMLSLHTCICSPQIWLNVSRSHVDAVRVSAV